MSPSQSSDGLTRIPAEFSGGYDTDPVDHGRPVTLIAAALGVPPEVFREAFSGVNPARGGLPPTPERARENKAVLMAALGPYGVTNKRLDVVSDYYRYRPGNGRLWRVRNAKAYALVKDGALAGFEITDGGAGYSTPPTIRVEGFPDLHVAVQLAYGPDLEHNGALLEITDAE